MPLFEFRCTECEAVTEILRMGSDEPAANCAACGSAATVKVISRVSFKIARRAMYSEDFLDKAQPFLKTQQQTAEYYAEAKGSDDAKTFSLAERIGERIDRTLSTVRRKQRSI